MRSEVETVIEFKAEDGGADGQRIKCYVVSCMEAMQPEREAPKQIVRERLTGLTFRQRTRGPPQARLSYLIRWTVLSVLVYDRSRATRLPRRGSSFVRRLESCGLGSGRCRMPGIIGFSRPQARVSQDHMNATRETIPPREHRSGRSGRFRRPRRASAVLRT